MGGNGKTWEGVNVTGKMWKGGRGIVKPWKGESLCDVGGARQGVWGSWLPVDAD
jgi:hypothetical protein